MTADEAITVLDKVGHIAIIGCDEGQFYVYTCPLADDGSLDMDKQTMSGAPCDTIQAALDDWVSQFSRD